MSKNYAPQSYPSLAAVVHGMVKRAPSGLDAKSVADYLTLNYQTMMSELSRQPGHKLGADQLLPLMDACDSNAPLVFLARQRGGVYVPMPDPQLAGVDLALARKLADATREFAEFMQEVALGISDGTINAPELARIDKEGDEALEAIVAMKKLARATYEAQRGGGK
jgi:HAMP domain-containing protein